MSEETKTTQQTADIQPEDNGAEGRTFTQDEVNKIISERLARERAKGEANPAEAKEAELMARESRLSCQEFLQKAGLNSDLLDVLDTSNYQKFVHSFEKLRGCSILRQSNGAFEEDRLRDASRYLNEAQNRELPPQDGLMRKIFGLN